MTCPLRPLIYTIKCSIALAPYEFVTPAKQGVFVASCSHGGTIRRHLTPVQQSVDMHYATTLYRIWNYGKPTMLFLFSKLFFGFSIRPTHTLITSAFNLLGSNCFNCLFTILLPFLPKIIQFLDCGTQAQIYIRRSH